MLRLEEGLLGLLQRNIPSSQAGVPHRCPEPQGSGSGFPRPCRAGSAPPSAERGRAGSPPHLHLPGTRAAESGHSGSACAGLGGAGCRATPWPGAWNSGWAASLSSPATTSRATGAESPTADSARCFRRGTSVGGPSMPSNAPPASCQTPPGICPPRRPSPFTEEKLRAGSSRGRGRRG